MNRLNVTVPVFNEEGCLAQNIHQLVQFLAQSGIPNYEVVLADNGSTDASLNIAQNLAAELTSVRVIHLDRPGRGRALKHAWMTSDADLLSYTDADLSSDLNALPPMVDAVINGRADIVLGSRLLQGSTTRRCLTREVMSRAYCFLVRALFHPAFSDPQCGFKVLSREAVKALLPHVQDNAWFFDTELLVLAERANWRIMDMPVKWSERRASHVRIIPTSSLTSRGSPD